MFTNQLENIKKSILNNTEQNEDAQIISEIINNLSSIEQKFNQEKEKFILQFNNIEEKLNKLRKSKAALQEGLKTKDKNLIKLKKEEINNIEKEISELEIQKQDTMSAIQKQLLDLIGETKDLMKAEIQDVEISDKQLKLTLESIAALVESFQPIALSFNLFEEDSFDIHEQHVASNREDKEGIYARTQQNARLQHKVKKYNLENLENRFEKNIKEAVRKEKLSSVGANNTRLNSVYFFESSSLLSKSQPITPRSHNASIRLKDDILKHKYHVVKTIVNNMQDKKLTNLIVNKNQLQANYPCLMIIFAQPPLDKNNEIIEGYSEFVTQLMIAKINVTLKARGIVPLIDRRQSFGFLTPTLTDTNTALRLSLGLTPHTAWIEAVQDGIIACDQILSKLRFKEKTSKGDVEFICLDQYVAGDFSGYAHKLLEEISADQKDLIKDINFLGLMSNPMKGKSNKDLSDWLVQSCEIFKADSLPADLLSYRGKYLLIKSSISDNLSKDNYALYYVNLQGKIKPVNIADREKFIEKIVNPFVHGKKDEFSSKVFSLETMKIITGQIHPVEEVAEITVNVDDNDPIAIEYYELYERVDAVLKNLSRLWVGHHQDDHQDLIFVNDINQVAENTKRLVAQSNSIGTRFFTQLHDLITFDTSDDDELLVGGHEESRKNYRTPWGMSAIFAPMEALRRSILSQNQISAEGTYPLPYKCTDFSYFEINLAWNGALLNTHFIRSDRVEHYLTNHIISTLLEGLTKFPFTCSFVNELVEINNKEFDKDIYKNFIINYIQKIYRSKHDAKAFNEASKELLNIMRNETSPCFTLMDAENLLHKLHFSIMQTIADYCKQRSANDYIRNTKTAEVIHIDANPCVNNNGEVINCVDLVKKISTLSSPPKLLIIDTTSTTQDQLREIIKAFDDQDNIPMLVTAMSGLKNSQLGLDCFPYGENKMYISKKCTDKNKDTALLCEEFSYQLKEVTRGTEMGLSRLMRRELNSSAHIAEKQSKKYKI